MKRELIGQMRDARLRRILASSHVTEAVVREFGEMKLCVLYQGAPRFFPKHARLFKRDGDATTCVLQREVIIRVPWENGGKWKTICFAASWIDTGRLGARVNAELRRGKRSLGAILAKSGQAVRRGRMTYRGRVSKPLGAALGKRGAVRVVERSCVLRVDGKAAIFLQEFFPV